MMKGVFSLRRGDLDPDALVWGNLDEESGQVAHISNLARSGYSARLIAHDVIEHTIKHRTARYVTFEEELRAFGAMCFVRSLDPLNDVIFLLEQQNRDLKNPPIIYPDMELMDYEDISCDPNQIEPIRNNLNFGYWIKHRQYNGNHYVAGNHFAQLRSMLEDQLKQVEWDNWNISGVTVNFNLDTGHMNIRNKWYP